MNHIFNKMNKSQEYCDNFWIKVNNPGTINDCWEWLASKYEYNYGKYRKRLAHRISYEYFYGPISHGMLVCHSC
jgi:hypothetical protein